MLTTALVLSALAPLSLRFGWQWRRWPVVAGWTSAFAATVILLAGYGAWGLAMGATMAMVVALALLAHAAIRTPAGRVGRKDRVPASRPSDPADWRNVRRRLSVFLVTVPLGLLATSFFSWTMQRALFRAGWHEADTTALALFIFPLLWIAMLSWQMVAASGPGSMARPLLACAAAGTMLWIVA